MRAKSRLNPTTQMVQYGYGWVEGNKLSARYNGGIHAVLPVAYLADGSLDVVENGRFLKYDYANGVCNLTGPSEWMMVFNEVKVYEDRETDADFAMVRDNYEAIVYNAVGDGRYAHYMPGTGDASTRELLEFDNSGKTTPKTSTNGGMMPAGSTMVPRLIQIGIGDIMTTNTVKDKYEDVNEGDFLVVDADGYLKDAGATLPAAGTMALQVVKKYNMPDLQPGVKLMRVQ